MDYEAKLERVAERLTYCYYGENEGITSPVEEDHALTILREEFPEPQAAQAPAPSGEQGALREALIAEHHARMLMQDWLEKHHPPKGQDWIDYREAIKDLVRIDEMTRAALLAQPAEGSSPKEKE